MKKSRIVSFLTAFALVAVIPLSVSATTPNVLEKTKESQATVSHQSGESKAVSGAKGGRFEPLKTRKPVDGQKIGNRTQDDFEFDIPAGFGWVKVYVMNTGDTDINVTVTDSKGKEVMGGVAKPGKPFDEKGSSPWKTGLHTVSVTSVEDMSGKVSVKIAETKREL
ncbi:hypothetical protein EEL32_17100 [Brevibacillus laterosporus]|nr:hypothetical protein [Brevibacillus laterosporus]RAP28422.1 hypothetical protein C2W64_04856 [Brevibacillus laterosporus]TPG84225.1 hypothetical protein EEL32_17100 [Brevibacillus laterosporus]